VDVDPEPAVATPAPVGGGGKRKAVVDIAPPVKRATASLGKRFEAFKKDTLQNMCEDLDVPVSGNKDELISRILEAL